MKRLLAFAMMACVLSIAPALAGIGGHNGEIGFDFGGANLDKGLSDSSAGRASIRGGYHFTSLFQIEGQDVGMGTSDTSAGVDTTTTVFAIFVNGVFNFHVAHGNVVPYVLGGVGLATVTIDPDPGGKADDTGSATQIAAGCRFFFGANKRAAVRVEYSHMDHKTSGLVLGGLLLSQDRFKDDSFTAGFTWRLGASK